MNSGKLEQPGTLRGMFTGPCWQGEIQKYKIKKYKNTKIQKYKKYKNTKNTKIQKMQKYKNASSSSNDKAGVDVFFF